MVDFYDPGELPSISLWHICQSLELINSCKLRHVGVIGQH